MSSSKRALLSTRALAPIALIAMVLCACSDGYEEASQQAGEGTVSQSSPMADLALLEDLRPQSSEELIAASQEGSPEHRQRATLAMGRIQSADYATALAKAADPQQPKELRRTALFALGQLGLAQGAEPQPEAIAAVRSMFQDDGLQDGGFQEKDEDILALAVEAYGKLAPEGAPEVLTPFLSHGDAAVRREAAHALFRTRFVPVWRRQATVPPELPPVATTALIQALQGDSPEVRRAAAHAFSRYGHAEAAGSLGPLLEDADEWVRLFAARGLSRGGEGPEVALERLSKMASEDSSPRVRTEAVAALGGLGAPDRIPATASQDDSFHVRAAFATAWRAAGKDENTDKILRRLLKDPAPTVQTAALASLAQRLQGDALPELQTALQDPSWVLRSAAVRALGHAGLEGLPAVEKALEDDDLRVRTAALESLAQLADTPEATERIAAALTTDDLAVRGTAVGLLAERRHPQRFSWLEDIYRASPGVEWVEVREGVVDALAAEEDNPGNHLLQQIAAEDPASSVRSRARSVLTTRSRTLPDEKPSKAPEPSPFLATPSTGTSRDNPTVILKTSKGTLEILVLADRAPIHAANFLKLVEDGVYNGLIWHRVVPNFVIQGGDPQGNGWGGPGYTLRDEISPGPFLRGSVGMPKAGKDTGGCQLFITHVPTPHLDGNYTIFGQVTAGLEVVDRIEVGDAILEATIRTR